VFLTSWNDQHNPLSLIQTPDNSSISQPLLTHQLLRTAFCDTGSFSRTIQNRSARHFIPIIENQFFDLGGEMGGGKSL
jgi:hypothetical protein